MKKGQKFFKKVQKSSKSSNTFECLNVLKSFETRKTESTKVFAKLMLKCMLLVTAREPSGYALDKKNITYPSFKRHELSFLQNVVNVPCEGLESIL